MNKITRTTILVVVLVLFGTLTYFLVSNDALVKRFLRDEQNGQAEQLTKQQEQEQPSEYPSGNKEDLSKAGNELVDVEEPRINENISSPLKVVGKAKGSWYFEGVFDVVLTDWDGKIIGEDQAQAQGDWMTNDYVPFEAEIKFEKPELYDRGTLILQKANPSGLPENENALEFTIYFE